MTDAKLSFAVDSTQAQEANQHLDTMTTRARAAEGGFRDLHSASMLAGAGMASFNNQLGMGSTQLGQFAGALQSVVNGVQAARGQLDGLAGSFATFERARVQAEGLATALGTSATSMEAFSRQASQLNMTSLETASALQRVTSAIEGQTAAGRALRTMMQDYGVVLDGISSSSADKVLLQFVDRVRSFAQTSANTQSMQQVLGPLGLDAITSVQHPGYEPAQARADRLRVEASSRRSAEAISALAVDRERIARESTELTDLQGLYGRNPRPGGMFGDRGQIDLMAAMFPPDAGPVSDTMRRQQYSDLAATPKGNLQMLQYLAAHPTGTPARGRRGFWGRDQDDFQNSVPERMRRGEFDSTFAATDMAADRDYEAAGERSLAGTGGWGDWGPMPAIQRYIAQARPRIGARMGQVPSMPTLPVQPARPLSPADQLAQQTADAGRLGEWGLGGPAALLAAQRRVRTIENDGDPGDLALALGRRFGEADGQTMFANVRDTQQHAVDTAMQPGAAELDQAQMASWLQNVPVEQRAMARQLLSIAQANGVSTSAWTRGAGRSFSGLMTPGATGAGAPTGPMQTAAFNLQANDDANFSAQSRERANDQIDIQRRIRDTLVEGSGAVERLTGYWQTYYQMLEAGKSAEQARTAALAQQNEVIDKQRTAGEQMIATMRQKNALDEQQGAGLAGAGMDPAARLRAQLMGGINADYETQRRATPGLSEADYRSERLRAAGIGAVTAGQGRVSQQLDTNLQQDNVTRAAMQQGAAQREVLNGLETEREFREQIVTAQAAGNAAQMRAIREQIEAVKALKGLYDEMRQMATNLDMARDNEFQTDFNRRLLTLNPEEQRRARAQQPFLRANRDNPEVNPPAPPPGPRARPISYEEMSGASQPYAGAFRAASDATGGRLSPEVMAVLGYREGSLMADPPIGTGGTAHRGMMQFDAATGVRAGLRIDGTVDERLDPSRAIPAAGRDLGRRMDLLGITSQITDLTQLHRLLGGGGGYGSSSDANTDRLYDRALRAGQNPQSPAAASRALNSGEDLRLSEEAVQNQEAGVQADYAHRQATARRRAVDAGTGSLGADYAGAAVGGPEANAAENAARRLSSVVDALNAKFAEQRAAMVQTQASTRGLAEAWSQGRQVGEEFERTLSNRQQVGQLQALQRSDPAAARRVGADRLIGELNQNSADIDRDAAMQKGIGFRRQQASFGDENELLAAQTHAGWYASAETLGNARADVLSKQFLRTGATKANGEAFSEDEVRSTFRMNEQMKQLASDTQTVRQNFVAFGSAAMQGFENAVIGGQKLSGVLHSLAQDMERTLLKSFVEAPLEKLFSKGMDSVMDSAGGWLGSLLAAAPAVAATGTILNRPRFMAAGGLLTSPTTFLANGGTVTAGEVDTEAVMPIKRLPNGNLGVQSSGGRGGASIIVNSPITIHGSGGGGSGGGGAMSPAAQKQLQAHVEAMHTQAVRAVLTNEMRDGGDLTRMGRRWS